MPTSQWLEQVIDSVAHTVAARVFDPHDVPLLGPIAVQIHHVDGNIVTGTICSAEEHAPDIETTGSRFTTDAELKEIRMAVYFLVVQGESFVTKTRDGSILWTIGLPVPSED
ncbi:MAG: hypothetical protein WCW66_02120 [Patescibacteria group bacterium]|jgi:hypothetical protein